MDNQNKLRRLQAIELSILRSVKEICDKHQLTYYLAYGTLLGAVRHEGFIPWDDDVDILMPRPDFERFMYLADHELEKPLILQTKEKDKSFPFGHAQVQNTQIKIRTATRQNAQVWNAWIDILPLDAMPKNKLHFFTRKYHILYRRMMCNLADFPDIVNIHKTGRPWYENLIIFIAIKTHPERYLDSYKQYRKFHNYLSQYPFEKGYYLVDAYSYYKFKSLFKKSIYGKGTVLLFEGEQYRVPEQYEFYLKQIYGDYMTLPPKNKRNHHEREFVE